MIQPIDEQRDLLFNQSLRDAVCIDSMPQERLLAGGAGEGAGRFVLRTGHSVVLGFNDPWGRSVAFTPRVRGVSRTGLLVVHSMRLEIGQRVACLFVGPEHAPGLRISGAVSRCKFVRGSMYEVDVTFEHPAPIYRFVRAEAEDPTTSDACQPYPTIAGIVRQLTRLVEQGAPLTMLREGVVDLELAIDAEQRSRDIGVDPNTGLVGPEELD